MKAQDVMTRHVIGIAADATTSQAFELMERKSISGLPVLDPRGELMGIVTRHDLIRSRRTRPHPGVDEFMRRHPSLGAIASWVGIAPVRSVRDIMTRDPVTVAEQTRLGKIVALLNHHRIKRVPVMHGDRIVGIVSRGDVIRALAQVLGSAQSQETLDADLEMRVRAQLAGVIEGTAPPVQVSVKRGEVELHGTVRSDRVHDAIRQTVANTNGVCAIRDRLVSTETVRSAPEPASSARAS
jgi:CBS-domain-containing membrane protein